MAPTAVSCEGKGEQGSAHQEELDTSSFIHSDRNMHVHVERPQAGYMCTLSMLARVPLAPDRLYTLLTDPQECLRIFKSLKRVHHRRIIADDGAGNRTVEVDQTGAWRFLLFRGSFTVRMLVEQRAHDRTIVFRLAKPGFMKDFSGTWRIEPFDNSALDRLVNRHKPTAMHRLQAGLRAAEYRLGLAGPQEESLVQLQQSIAPAFKPPPAVARVLQRIAAKQITKIMTDLQTEVQRMNASSKCGSGSGGAEAAADGEPQRRHGKKAHPPQQDKKQLAAHVGPLRS